MFDGHVVCSTFLLKAFRFSPGMKASVRVLLRGDGKDGNEEMSYYDSSVMHSSLHRNGHSNGKDAKNNVSGTNLGKHGRENSLHQRT